MKTTKLITFLVAMVLAFTACETEVEDPAGLRSEGVVPSITNLNPAVFDVNDPSNTFIQFDLDINAADRASVKEVKLIVSLNGNKQRVEVLSLTDFPQNIKVFMKEAASALGMKLEDIGAGDAFNFEVLTIQGDKTYRSSASFNAAVVCAYDPDLVTGSYRAVSADWAVDGTVTLTVDPQDEYIVYVAGLAALDGLTEDQGPLKMVVNPLDFSVVAEKTVLASSAFGYTNIAYAGDGLLSTCDGSYEMLFNITVDQGSFGSFAFTFTKQ
ncbi:MAG: hypothetical protein K0B15_01800 [Lentimicrobium sp.]|nr:hypothetical protein [Lentimicrobium sp.]